MSRHGKYAEDTVKVQFAASRELRERLREAAREEGVKMSDLIRDGIEWRLSASKAAVTRLHNATNQE